MLSPPPISRTRTRLVLTRIPDSWAWVRTDLLIRLLPFAARSEEHTSELQSQSNLVCRLLLEKKKKDVGIRSDPEHAFICSGSTAASNCYLRRRLRVNAYLSLLRLLTLLARILAYAWYSSHAR